MKIQRVNNLNFNVSQKQINKGTSANNVVQKQINELSNVYYKPVTFGRKTAEHKSWGAQIDPTTKEASFKIFTYPDTKKIVVTVIKRDNENDKKEYVLENKGKGIFKTPENIPAGEVEHGDRYYYTIYKGNGDIDKVKDPYSYRQEKILGESTIYDQSVYKWKDSDWYKPENVKRISKRSNDKDGKSSVSNARIYEMNVATFTSKGNFEAAKKALKSVADSGFNAVELMPVENTFSFNWGYDGVDKLAASEYLGGPDGLKEFVDTAHSLGLNVIMDVVPNHLGQDGASMRQTGPYIECYNAFGEKFNYERENNEYVRDYIVNSALNWVENYHCDGLRFDMTHYIDSDNTMKQIAAELDYHHPDVFLIAEDPRANVSVDGYGNSWQNGDEVHDKRITSPLEPYESGKYENEDVHDKAIKNIIKNRTNLSRLGYNSVWDFFFYHNMKEKLYGGGDMDQLDKAVLNAQESVKYIMSHDEIGNFEGTRLIPKLMVPMLHLNENMVLNEKDKKRAQRFATNKNCDINSAMETVKVQKAQFVSEKLATMLQTGQLDKYDTKNIGMKKWKSVVETAFKKEVLVPLGINPESDISYERLVNCFKKAFDKNKMALARIYSIPGPKMVFQGDDKADMTPFRFFRQFDSVKTEDSLETEKGYKTDISALKASKIGNIKYSADGRILMNKFRTLTKDLNALTDANPALIKGRIIPDDTVKHPASQVYATHARDEETNNDIYSITNFLDAEYPRADAADYYIKFPKGTWIEVLNTDDKKYGGSGNFVNQRVIYSNGNDNLPVKLASQSTAIFKKIH